MELYKKYRPKSLDEVVGQDNVVQILEQKIEAEEVPHLILLGGPSGCGKTTIARIVADSLECSGPDFQEINCADFRGIDMARDIRAIAKLSPISSPTKVWIIDEAHKLTPDAQDAFLKLWEDTPEHCYFVLCTTEPGRLKKTIQTRASEYIVRLLDSEELEQILDKVVETERKSLSQDAREALIEASEGSPRKLLVLLDSIIDIEVEEDQLKAIRSSDAKAQAIELARALMKTSNWGTVAKILRDLEEDPETLRWMVLGYANAILTKKKDERAYRIIDAFRDNFYDSKKAGLTAACWEVIFD